MAEKKLSYEEAMGNLEEIVKRLESDNVPLDEAVKMFEEGTRLSAYCYDMLNSAKLKVTEIKKETLCEDEE